MKKITFLFAAVALVFMPGCMTAPRLAKAVAEIVKAGDTAHKHIKIQVPTMFDYESWPVYPEATNDNRNANGFLVIPHTTLDFQKNK